MTERDFDQIFKDKIGDELPFDFRPSDWLAAEQELDKLMPLSAPVASTPSAPSIPFIPRLLTWHKWAAAAAVLLLGSQIYLMTQLSKVKEEVVALHQEKTELKVVNKTDITGFSANQSVVIHHDTVVKNVYIEVPQKGSLSEQLAQDKKRSNPANAQRIQRFEGVEATDNSLDERNEVIALTPKMQGTTTPKMNLVGKDAVLNTGSAEKIALNTVENTLRMSEQKETVANSQTELNKNESTKNELSKNELGKNELDKNELDKSGLTDVKKENPDKLVAINSVISQDNTPNLTDIKRENTLLAILPKTDLATIKSISRAKNWLNDETFDFILTAKPVIIKPICKSNAWEVSVNSLLLVSEEHRKPRFLGVNKYDKDEQRMSIGANVRVGYHIRNNIRLLVEADIWKERHGQDTMGRTPILPSDFTLATVEQTFTAFQVRIGADYKLRTVWGLKPFVGIGLAYQKRANDDLQFRYKKDNKSLPPIAVPNEAKFEKPVYLSFRAGLEGKIYKGLSWSVDVNAERGAMNRKTFMSHLGLKYAF
ncbi:MAG: hypothetical protein U5L45_12015 [Saprospiraceae bacterium]|nr:hypothetical protein [Saprospiraceae bacterium]